jgi:kynureninase
MPSNPLLDPAHFVDELADFRSRFVIPEPNLIYLDGNSLGRLPRLTATRLQHVVEEDWGKGLIRSWNTDWYNAPIRIGEKIARIIGAAPGQVIISDSTSINLFKLVMAALANKPERTKIVTDELNFPSDLYILQSCIALLGKGHTLHIVRSRDGVTIHPDDLASSIDENTAVVSLSHVAFKSGFMYDGQEVTRLAYRAGAFMLWDLCHSVGAVPVELDAWGADLAVGCTYKYLNGGPGSPAFLYVRRDLQEKLYPPMWGWFAERSPFAFELDFAPAPGMAHFLVSSPPILSTLAMEASLDVLLEAGMERIRRKSVAQTNYLIDLFDANLTPLGFTLGTPRDPNIRGSHVSIRHAEGYRINRALIEEMDLIPDFREPDNIRLGIAPLYISFKEIYEGVERIRRVVDEHRYLHYPQVRLAVT